MGKITDAIDWGKGLHVTLSMFTVWDAGTAKTPTLSFGSPKVETYVLEDESGVLGGQVVFEYDFIFQEIPSDLEAALRAGLLAARAAGARVAWFAFEGSFHYDSLLTKQMAGHVYAVADSRGVSIASDEGLLSEEWQERVATAGIEARAAKTLKEA